jgi:oligopeptidase B
MPLRFASVLVAAAVLLPAAATAQQGAPRARIVPTFDTLHGDVRRDDYFWMRDRSNPETIAYLEAENAWTAEQMRGTEQLQEKLYEEIVGRIKQTDLSVPFRENGYWYYTRTEQGKNYPIFCRKRGTLEAPEEIILDQNVLAEGKAYHGLAGWEVSPDGRYLAYLEDTTALRWNTLRIKDLRTGRLLPDVVDSVTGGPVWANDNATLFYVRADSARRDNRVLRHTIGAGGADPVVVQEDDLLFSVNVDRLRSGRYLAISHFSFTSTEVRVLDADRPTDVPRIVEPRRADVEYAVDHHGDRFLIVTNDGAPNFRVMSAPVAAPGRANWTEWLPYDPAVFTERIAAYRDFVVLSQRVAGLRTLNVVDAKTKRVRAVRMPEKAYGVSLGGTPDYDSDTFRYTYSSFVTPPSVYDHDVRRHRSELQKAEQIAGFDRTRYGVERFEVRARDGALVPVSVVYRKPLVKNGRNPLLLYAYGSYGATMEPTFNPALVSLLDRGVVYALAHVRGGQEKGRAWYDDGKMLRKKNTFHDFIDVADHLVKEKWTAPEKLVANGGSAGGLLMGVVANMRPDLFKAVVADVPFVDVINTMRDASIPLTAAEWVQWGNPVASEEEYRYMLSYSPYDNVEAKDYPWLLVTTSLNDSQVAYWEPAKWTARLRTLKTDTNPLLLKTNMAGGHGGSSGRYARWKETAFRYAFMLKALGMAPAPTP